MNEIKIKFPARISMNLFTYPNKIVKGGYGIAIKMNNYLSINRSIKDEILVESGIDNVDLLIKYYLDEFRKISNMNFNVKIVLKLDNRFKNHQGFAFNSNIACALYFSLNKLLNDKFTKEQLLKYLFSSYAELNNNKISKNDSTCMISQYCALNGGMNVVDDLKCIYNYKFSNNYKLLLIHFMDKVKNDNIEEMKQKKKSFIPIYINKIRKILYNELFVELNKDNINCLKKYNLAILKGSTRILRCLNYIESDKMIKIMNELSSFGIVGLTSSSPTIYYISDNIKKVNLKYDIYEIDNEGIKII